VLGIVAQKADTERMFLTGVLLAGLATAATPAAADDDSAPPLLLQDAAVDERQDASLVPS